MRFLITGWPFAAHNFATGVGIGAAYPYFVAVRVREGREKVVEAAILLNDDDHVRESECSHWV